MFASLAVYIVLVHTQTNFLLARRKFRKEVSPEGTKLESNSMFR